MNHEPRQGTAARRAALLRDQVLRTWSPPFHGATMASAVQTSAMVSIAWCFGRQFLGDLTTKQAVAIERGLTEFMQAMDPRNDALPHRVYIQTMVRKLDPAVNALAAAIVASSGRAAIGLAETELFLLRMLEQHGPYQWLEETNAFIAKWNRRGDQ